MWPFMTSPGASRATGTQSSPNVCAGPFGAVYDFYIERDWLMRLIGRVVWGIDASVLYTSMEAIRRSGIVQEPFEKCVDGETEFLRSCRQTSCGRCRDVDTHGLPLL